MIKHFLFVSAKGLAIPLLLSAFSVSIWQMPNICQSKHYTDNRRWISQMLEFHQELFGLMSLAYCGSDTHHYGIVPIFSKDLAQIKRTNKLQQNFDKFPPMLITYMSYNKISYAGSIYWGHCRVYWGFSYYRQILSKVKIICCIRITLYYLFQRTFRTMT